MHASVRDLPLWLDEGIAEYFESPLGRGAKDLGHDSKFRDDVAAGWKPDLGKLMRISDIRSLTQRDYREAWSWVRLFLEDEPTRKRFLACLSEYAGSDQPEGRAAAIERFLQDTTAERRMLVYVYGLKPLQAGPARTIATALSGLPQK